jgi:hypothetical protein
MRTVEGRWRDILDRSRGARLLRVKPTAAGLRVEAPG